MLRLRAKIRGIPSSIIESALVDYDKGLAMIASGAKGARRLAALVAHDEGEMFRELAELYELQIALLTNFRNKWFTDEPESRVRE